MVSLKRRAHVAFGAKITDILEAYYRDGYENGVHLVCEFDITNFDPEESDEVDLIGDVSTESVDYYDLIQKIKEY